MAIFGTLLYGFEETIKCGLSRLHALREKPQPSASGRAIRSEEGFLVARYEIVLDDQGRLAPATRRLAEHESAGDNVWYAYVEPNPPSEWFNSETYVDTFSKPAMARFLELTHEVYKAKVGNKFGKCVPSMFTDEPQFAHKTQLVDAWQRQDVFLPWSLDLVDSFREQYSHDLLDGLPQIIWDNPSGQTVSVTRYQYHDHVCERFVRAFMDQLSDWCRKNGIFLIGHMMKEPFLWSQTGALGEAMRCYRNLNLPGIDILCDRFEFNTAKQAVSVARQNGSRGVMSEIYGVTNWTFDFEGHKGSGDWQAALGVTFRVPHLTWISMAGEAKRDYPSSIGYQSPWFREYKYIENYFARINVALTRGRAVTRVAVIHPIESYWLCHGPVAENFAEQSFREQAFGDLTNWLLFGLVDFDFISESLLPNQVLESPSRNGYHASTNGTSPRREVLRVGQCEYETVLVPNLRTIRSSTLKSLRDFQAKGGKVIITGDAPSLVDAQQPVSASSPVIDSSVKIPFSKYHVLQAVEDNRDLRISETNGKSTNRFLYQLREDGEQRYLFICNTERKTGPFTIPSTIVSVRGLWTVQMLDPFTGEERDLASDVSRDQQWTVLNHYFNGCSSLLLRLSPGRPRPDLFKPLVLADNYRAYEEVKLLNVKFSESNVLLLDYAEYKLNTESDWHAAEEILRIDNIVRKELGIPLKLEAYRQPWSIPNEKRKPLATLMLRFTFTSEYDIEEPTALALEDPQSHTISLNNETVLSEPNGWWVDEAIKTIPLPLNVIKKGQNSLTLTCPVGLLTNLERVYLLGKFGVNLRGRLAALTPLDLENNTAFGDFTRQSLPFYAGNVEYNCTFTVPEPAQQIALYVPRFASPVISVDLDGYRKGLVAFEPNMLELGELSPGEHHLELRCFGNRFNSFGHVHLPDGASKWCGPLLWRTDDSWWTAEYSIKPMGILQTPRVMVKGIPKAAFWKEGPTY